MLDRICIMLDRIHMTLDRIYMTLDRIYRMYKIGVRMDDPVNLVNHVR
jgi:hypothetical protein